MLYSNVQILGLAHIDAPGTLASSEIERRLAPALSRLGISNGILEKLSGITSRRTFALDFAPSEGASQAAEKAMKFGVKEVDVKVKGPGSGRESAITALQAACLSVKSIEDSTPIPHNGCRPRKKRRV